MTPYFTVTRHGRRVVSVEAGRSDALAEPASFAALHMAEAGPSRHFARQATRSAISAEAPSRPSHSVHPALGIRLAGCCLSSRKHLWLISDLVPNLLGLFHFALSIRDGARARANSLVFQAPPVEKTSELGQDRALAPHR
jgi:hypothetical protein